MVNVAQRVHGPAPQHARQPTHPFLQAYEQQRGERGAHVAHVHDRTAKRAGLHGKQAVAAGHERLRPVLRLRVHDGARRDAHVVETHPAPRADRQQLVAGGPHVDKRLCALQQRHLGRAPARPNV